MEAIVAEIRQQQLERDRFPIRLYFMEQVKPQICERQIASVKKSIWDYFRTDKTKTR